MPAAFALGRLSLPQLLAVALLVGTATVFFRAAYPVFLTSVVPADQLEDANSRLLGTESAMQVAGPGLGGLLAQVVSAAAGLVLDAASFLVSAPAWPGSGRRTPPRPGSRWSRSAGGSGWASTSCAATVTCAGSSFSGASPTSG